MSEANAPNVDPTLIDDLALEALAETFAVEPSPGLRTRVLECAHQEAEHAALSGRVRRWRLAGAAAIAASAALSILWMGERRGSDELERTVQRLASDAARAERDQAEIAALRDSAAIQAEIVRILANPDAKTARLEPPAPDGSQARGRVVMDSVSGQVVVLGQGLPALGVGRIYELWAIRGAAAPEPAGLFARETAQGFSARVPDLERPEEITAFAISIEPEGGSETPTGPIVLVGPVGI